MDDYFAGSTVGAPRPTTEPLPPQPQAGVGASVPPQPQPWSVPVPPQQPWGVPVAPPQTGSGPSRLLIGLLATLGAIVLVGVLAAIAVPVYLERQDLSRTTTVTAPEEVLGMPSLTDEASETARGELLAIPGPGDHVSGVYGADGVSVMVGAAHYRMRPNDQADFLRSSVREGETEGVTFRDIDAGALGGTMRCGESADPAMTLCVFVDGGSYGVVVVTGPSEDPTGLARSAREAFVRRT